VTFRGLFKPTLCYDSISYVCFGASDSETIKRTKQCLPTASQFKSNVFHGASHQISVCVPPRGGGSERGCQEPSSRRGCRIRGSRLEEPSAAFPAQERDGGVRCRSSWEHGVVGAVGKSPPRLPWGFPRGTPAFTPLLPLGSGKSPVFSAQPLHRNGKQCSLFANVHHQSFKDA